ncbi:O-antigen ligase family protein [Photobacterium leiognathi]|uniref:O-antigen ligase family protein n=1 Tax=Photobacterium leiognathi TaxID=553611 RepID=UPI002980C819|nr:O-antigen ligase family protein [Photobacterium leiognathi]
MSLIILPFFYLVYIAIDKKYFCYSKVFFLFYLLLAFQFFSIFTSETSVSFINDFLDIYKLLMCFFCFSYGLTVSKYVTSDMVNRVLLTVSVIIFIICFLQLIFGPSIFYYLFSGRDVAAINEQFTSRIIGTLGNPNYVAVYFCSMFFFCFFEYLKSKSKLYLCVCFLFFVFLLLTQSRSTLVYFLILLLMFYFIVLSSFWISRRDKATFSISIAVFVFISSVIVYMMIVSGRLGYIYSGFNFVLDNGLSEQSSFSGRLIMWNYYYELISNNILFGYGPSKDYFKYSVADNNYIFIVFKYGLIGLVLQLSIFISLIFYLIRKVIHGYRTVEPLALFLGALILLSSMTSEMIDSMRITPFFFMITGLSIGMNKYGK